MLAAVLLAGCNDPTGPKTEISGQQLYLQYCARCHGPSGAGVPDAEPGSPGFLAASKPLNDPRRMKQLGDEHIMGVIRTGRMGQGGTQVMPPFASEFTEAKLMVLTAYVRSLSGTGGDHARAQE